MIEAKNTKGKQLSNPFSSGGGGPNFENQVQTLFVVLMLTEGFVPSLPNLPIKRIKLQGRYEGYNTDDFIVFVEDQSGEQKCRLLAQIKHSISITESDADFGDVIQAAWLDFHSPELFDRSCDVFALISGPLSSTDNEVGIVLDWARTSETAEEFLKKVNLTKFSSSTKRSKLQAFRSQLRKAKGNEVSDEDLWQFLKRFHLLGYDLGLNSGVILSLLKSLLVQFTTDPASAWALVAREVASFDQNAGTLTRETVSAEIKAMFSQRLREIPVEYVRPTEVPAAQDYSKGEHADALMFASLIGAWNEKVEGDREAISRLIESHD